MRNTAIKCLVAVSGLAMFGLAMAPAVQAQTTAKPSIDYWGGRSNGPNASCPQLEWTVVPLPRDVSGAANGPINGVAYYSDMSGISTIKGTIEPNGAISAHVTSIDGKGPAGIVVGQRGPSKTHIELRGEGCANAAFDLPRWEFPAQAGGD